MPVENLRIDEGTWEKASDARRREWRALLHDVPSTELWPNAQYEKMTVRFDDSALTLDLVRAGGDRETMTVPRSALEVLLSEYLSVIARLEEDGLHAARAEALDMAKRVVHDDAARKLATHLPDLTTSHATSRKFFSVVVSLAVDTTKSPSAHRHR